MDILESVLAICHFRVALYCRCENRAPWGIGVPKSTTAQFHAVRTGRCWIRLDGDRAVPLEEGDFVLIPHGDAHDVLDAPNTRAMALAEILAHASPSESRVLRMPGAGALSELVCGGCDFGNQAQQSLFSFLPRFLHLRAKNNSALRPVLDLADRELCEPRAASPTVLARLGDILFIEAIRAYSLDLRPGEGSWLGAILDPNIAPVLKEIHANPSEAWTLDVLARKAFMSRSSFASRFRELVGVPVRVYMTRLRMAGATAMLEDSNLTIAEIAFRMG